MKFLIAQTVKLKGVGILGMIFKVLHEFKPAAVIINEAYAVQWVDWTSDIRMGKELSPIKGLKHVE